jgi:hypothetical protein
MSKSEPVAGPWVTPKNTVPATTQPWSFPDWQLFNPYSILGLNQPMSQEVPPQPVPVAEPSTLTTKTKTKKAKKQKQKPVADNQSPEPEEHIQLHALDHQPNGYYLPGSIGQTKVLCLVD